MMIVACLYLLVSILCAFLWMGYSFFSNLEADSISVEQSDCRVTCLGAVAKQGPRLMRFANLLAFTLSTVLVIITEGADFCRGDVALTHNCLNFYDDCAFNQIK